MNTHRSPCGTFPGPVQVIQCEPGFFFHLQDVREQDEGAGAGAVGEDLRPGGAQTAAEGGEPA